MVLRGPAGCGNPRGLVVERLVEATADGTLATRIEAKLSARVANERATFVEVRRVLAAQIAGASATTAKLTDEVVRREGRAREVVEAKLRADTARLDDAERRLRAAEDDALDLELVESQREWIASALRSFGKVWGEMTPENQGRLLRALVAKVSVDEKTGICRLELVNTKVAQQLALAHHLQAAIDRGTIADRGPTWRGSWGSLGRGLRSFSTFAPGARSPSCRLGDGGDRRRRADGRADPPGSGPRRDVGRTACGVGASIELKHRNERGRLDASPSSAVLWKRLEACPFRLPEPELMSDEILTVIEVAALLKVADKTVYTMVQQGELPAFKVRGQWRFRRADIDA
jgi:excisionase family DNA binding protein